MVQREERVQRDGGMLCSISPKYPTSSVNAQLHKICCDWIFNLFFFLFLLYAEIGEREEFMARALEYTGEETKATNTQGYSEEGSWVRIF